MIYLMYLLLIFLNLKYPRNSLFIGKKPLDEHDVVGRNWREMKPCLMPSDTPWNLATVAKLMKCRSPISLASLDDLGRAFSTSHISTLHFHHYGANMCCSRAYGQRLLHFLGLQWEWVRCVKQVVKCKVFAQLKMKLCRIRMGEEGRTQDDFYYKFWT